MVNNKLLATEMRKKLVEKCITLLHSSEAFCHWNDEEVMVDVVGEAITSAFFRVQFQMTQDPSQKKAIELGVDDFPKSFAFYWKDLAQRRTAVGDITDDGEPINEDPN